MNSPESVPHDPIREALLSFMDEAKKEARIFAKKTVEDVEKELSAFGYDLAMAAPLPSGNLERKRYILQKRKRDFFIRLTKRTDIGRARRMNDPEIVQMDPAKIDIFVENCEKLAVASYEAYVAKLSKKIGPVIYAMTAEKNVWTYSILVVQKPDGTVERWKTSRILNTSSLGKMFHQWPSRKMKD